jgi:hypothetical protein
MPQPQIDPEKEEMRKMVQQLAEKIEKLESKKKTRTVCMGERLLFLVKGIINFGDRIIVLDVYGVIGICRYIITRV